MSMYGTPRPGTIYKAYVVECNLCPANRQVPCVTFEEASIWFTRHLDSEHPGWDEVTPYVAVDARGVCGP